MGCDGQDGGAEREVFSFDPIIDVVDERLVLDSGFAAQSGPSTPTTTRPRRSTGRAATTGISGCARASPTSYHVGQVVYLAKHWAGPSWRTLSIPRGRSRDFDVSKSGDVYGLNGEK